MLRAAEMRSAGVRFLKLRTYGPLVGNLFVRSLDRAERIYRSMVSRGFDGEIRLLDHRAIRWADIAFVVGWMAFFACARLWNLSELAARCLAWCVS